MKSRKLQPGHMVEMTGPRVNWLPIQSVLIMVHRGSPRLGHDYRILHTSTIMAKVNSRSPLHSQSFPSPPMRSANLARTLRQNQPIVSKRVSSRPAPVGHVSSGERPVLAKATDQDSRSGRSPSCQLSPFPSSSGIPSRSTGERAVDQVCLWSWVQVVDVGDEGRTSV